MIQTLSCTFASSTNWIYSVLHYAFSIFLQDRTAIVWDVRKLDFIRQLPEHPGPITCIAINNVTVSSSKLAKFRSL